MNILEAMHSGKRFRKKDWSTWNSFEDVPTFSKEYWLADDWEIEGEEKISITWREIYAKVCELRACCYPTEYLRDMLGFKE